MAISWRRSGALVAAFAAGLAAGLLAARPGRPNGPAPRMVEDRGAGIRFTNPLLDCESAAGAGFSELRPFQSRILAVIAQEKALGHISAAAVYFRDLNNGPWFGIDEEMRFSPASLLKVPLMMSYFRWAQGDPAVLSKPLCFERPRGGMTPELPSPRQLQLGRCYPVSELIERMIVDSDNQAAELLFRNLGRRRFEDDYRDLGIEAPSSADFEISVKAYASFFRILFNASYLSRDMSERALELLSRIEFKSGLRAGLPPDIPLAHKFGEREVDGARQLHDCGIVYYPRHPYLLCVMSRGERLIEMDDVMAKVSRATYEEARRQYLRR